MHWTERFLGAGYKVGAQGPELYDCWSFFRWVQREAFGRDVPFVPTPPGLNSIARTLAIKAGEFGWQEIDRSQARAGDGVMLSMLRRPTHVGVWVDDVNRGAVLHCSAMGAALHDLFHLSAAHWRVRGFYRFVSPVPALGVPGANGLAGGMSAGEK